MGRLYLNSTRLERLAHELSPKELAILTTLRQLRLVSATQLERLHFQGDTGRNRRRVLQSLAERGMVVRLDRVVGGRRAGSAGYLYALGAGGQRLLSQGQDLRVRRPVTPGAPFVAHTLAVTELAVRLSEVARKGSVEVLGFEAEPRCWRRHPGPGGGIVTCKPDAFIRLGIGAFEDSWFLEVDRATEGPATINRQLDAYRRYWASGIEQSRRGVFPRILWTVPNERRYQAIVDILGRQPAETWQLHLVTLYDNAIPMLTEGQS
jgi:hypothetical protein